MKKKYSKKQININTNIINSNIDISNNIYFLSPKPKSVKLKINSPILYSKEGIVIKKL